MIVHHKFRFKQPLNFKGLLFCSGLLFFLLILPFFTHQAAAWSPAGPWGGVIHDLQNHSAGSTTLYAGTGNGIYRYGNTLPWGIFSQTFSYRVLEVAVDPGSDFLYAIVVPSGDPFNFAQSGANFPPSGELYSLDIASGLFTNMGLADTDVTAIGVTSGGALLAGTDSGKLYRFSSGSFSQITISAPGHPVKDILASTSTDEVYLAHGHSSIDNGFIERSADAGLTWSNDLVLPGFTCLCLGRDNAGNVLVGSDDGQVWLRSSGAWSATQYGTGLPPYLVISFGNGAGGETFAVLRNHQWYITPLNNGPSGIFQMPATPSGAWQRWPVDAISTRIKSVTSSGSDLWIAFDERGIYSVQSGSFSNLPGEPSDKGIGAVSLNGIALDPRSDNRALAYGSSGLYELNDGTWTPINFESINNVSDTNTVQWIREGGFLSGSFSEMADSVIWVGGEGTGLFKGGQIASGSTTYQWSRAFYAFNADHIKDILPDPFVSGQLWWATDGGIYMSTNDCATSVHVDSSLGNLPIRDIDFELVEPQYRSFLAGTYTTGPSLLASDDGITWTGELYNSLDVLSVALAPVQISAAGRAIAGPKYGTNNERIALVHNSPWAKDTTVDLPDLNSPEFMSIKFPMGLDGDGYTDVFAVVWEDIYSSTADTINGFPGSTWVPISGNIDDLSVRSIQPDPKNGNLVWAATYEGSAYTLLGNHFNDTSAPLFRAHPDLPPGIMFEGIGSTANTIFLTWLAPGDDGDIPGWADRYELRYSDQPITDDVDFILASTITAPVPHISHTVELFEANITALGTSPVSFGLKAFDENSHPSSIVTTGLLNPVARLPVENVQSTASGNHITLTWDTTQLSGDPYFQNYGSITIGRNGNLVATLSPSQATWADSGLVPAAGFDPGDPVLYTITALDGAGNGESVALLTVVPSGGTGSSGSGGGGGCFIATAAFGSVMESEVQVLKNYRDSYLIHRSWGLVLVKAYGMLSPPLAAIISNSGLLRSITRLALAPIIAVVGVGGPSGIATPVPVFVGMIIFVLIPLMLIFIVCRRLRIICCNHKM